MMALKTCFVLGKSYHEHLSHNYLQFKYSQSLYWLLFKKHIII